MSQWRNRPGPAVKPRTFIEPSLAIPADVPPAGDDWVHEVKHDGYRMQLCVRDGRVRLFTRRGFDWTDRYPTVTASAAKLKVASASIDGELVILEDDGRSNWDRLHSRVEDKIAVLIAFDAMEHDGEDLRRLPLLDRKKRLTKIVRKSHAPGIQIAEHIEGDAAALFAAACQLGLEGIVSKKVGAPYRSGRVKWWVKTKNKAEDRSRSACPVRGASENPR